MNGIYFDKTAGDWAISVEAAGGVCGYAATAQDAAQRLSEELARWERYHRVQAGALAAMQGAQHAIEAVLAAPVLARHSATAQQETAKPRCLWAVAIRRAFGIAKGAGLDTRADEPMRAAVGRYLGRAVATRSALTAGDWLSVGDGIRRGELAW
jgi:hypothetical protein